MGFRIVRISAEILTDWFTEGFMLPRHMGERIRCMNGLPEGAKLVGVSDHLFFDTNDIALKFSHPSWADEPGLPIPELHVKFCVETVAVIEAPPDPDSPHIVSEGDS